MRFQSTSIIDFINTFQTDNVCYKYLAELKWKDGFRCTKTGCNHTTYWNGTKPFSRICKKCRKIHSPTQNTIFHGLRFSIKTAFMIVFETQSSTKSMSDLQLARRYKVNRNTAWLFMRKLRKALESSATMDMGIDEGSKVYVDEFVVGGYEIGMVGRSGNSKKRKIVIAVETTEDNKIKRAYAKLIGGYSADDLRPIFDDYISKTASVFVDGWRGYNPLATEWNIGNDEVKMKKSTHPINIVIQQFKSFVRGIHHHISAPHTEAYLNEFCFKLNRSQWKESLFHSAIRKVVDAFPLLRRQILKKSDFGLV